MSMPKIPCRKEDEAMNDLLESIALEETALAHFINAEAEKIQSFTKMIEKGKCCMKDIIEFQKNIAHVMRMPIKKQLLLQFKLEDVLEFKKDLYTRKDYCDKNSNNCFD